MLTIPIMYSVMNVQYNELETILRGITTVCILIVVYTREVINDEVLAVSITLSMFYIMISFRRIYVRYGCKIVGERAINLLSSTCCISLLKRCNPVNSSEDPTSTNGETSEL